MYLIRVFRNREQIARKVVAMTPDRCEIVGRAFCQLKGGAAFTVTPVRK